MSWLFSEYTIHLAIIIGIYLILCTSYNLCFGMGHLFNLAHVAAYAIGGYAVALLSTETKLSFVWCMVAAFLLSGLFAILLGAISMRLKQDYFAIGTLAFSSIVSALLINWKSLTHGVLGIPAIPRPVIFGRELTENSDFLLLVSIIAGFTLIVFKMVFSSAYGRKLRAQADQDPAARALGIDNRLIKNMSFLLSSAFAGLAGGLYACYINYIDPSSFGLSEMIFVLTVVVVGRPGSFRGCIIATFFLVLLPEPLRFIDMPPGILGPLRQILYAVILFVVVFINRKVLFPIERRI